MTEESLKELLRDMSLKEKVGQMMQLDSSCFSNEGPVTGPAAELSVDPEDFNLAGSILGVVGAEAIEKLQKLCMEKQPHHIPVLFMADIINGYRTIFPIPLALGCSFEDEAARTVGDVMARESAAAGLHVTFAPMVDLVRDARWGRIMESTGEDPYLNSRMAAAMVRGIQGETESYEGHLGACAKHFAAYGAPAAGREYNTVELSERTLREDYLPAYQAAIEAGAAMMMTSFNTLDRIPATGNKWLMQDILRAEMGFEGVLISDWNAIGELITHGVAEGKKEAARQAAEAGVDMDMMSGCYMAKLCGLAEEGLIPEDIIDTAVWRILVLKNRMGLFENPFREAGKPAEQERVMTKENRDKAREVAAQTMVLLKNEENFLPLDREEDVVFIGPYMEEKNILGAWSFFGNPEEAVTLKEGILKKKPDAQFARGCEVLNPGQTVYGFRFNAESLCSEPEADEMIAGAVKLAKGKHKVVLALGESNLQTGEGGSRGDITIPDIQKKLFRAVCEVNENVAVILFAGRPLDIREINEKAKSILYAWMPGTEGGNAAADILFGDTVPQAKLAMSLPYCAAQAPVHYAQLRTGRHTRDGEDIKNRFLSKYQDIPNLPLYPFGYGMGYTDFAVGEVILSSGQLVSGEGIRASVTVENTGDREGTETIQLYITDECASCARPVRELKGYKRVLLMPGEKREVSFTITEDMLRFYNKDMEYQAEKGKFMVWIGTDSLTENGEKFELV